MKIQTQKNQTGRSGCFDSVQLVGKNIKDNNTTKKRQPKSPRTLAKPPHSKATDRIRVGLACALAQGGA